jgi:hypothetical protein
MSWADLLAAAELLHASAVTADPRLVSLRLAGIGWATVEHERAEHELDAARDMLRTGTAPGAWETIGRDPALGAGMWRRVGADEAHQSDEGQLPDLVVLEPDTEGRLAASLARFGEGVAVIYLGSGRARPGRLVRGGPAWGPHVVIL